MDAEVSVLKNHGNGKKHSQILHGATSKQSTMNSFITQAVPIDKKHKVRVSIVQIELAAYIVEHNIAFLASDHLSDLMKEIFPDSKIAQDLSMIREQKQRQ